jgi:hypothetical protein
MFLGHPVIYFVRMNQMVSSDRSLGRLNDTDGILVDICITTDWKELEEVCMIAELLANSELYEYVLLSILLTVYQAA